MSELKQLADVGAFFSTYLADGDASGDADAVKNFAGQASAEKIARVLDQAKRLLQMGEGVPLDYLGAEANRWFADAGEALVWLEGIVERLEAAGAGGAANDVAMPKDSNGATLAEGDSVQVIKDLKVKGGSSDLKRGTLIKKIHLIGDPEAIECRVDGSTLVLKTCFLKKA